MLCSINEAPIYRKCLPLPDFTIVNLLLNFFIKTQLESGLEFGKIEELEVRPTDSTAPMLTRRHSKR